MANVFNIGFPPADRNFWSKSKLKSPVKMIIFFTYILKSLLLPLIDPLRSLIVWLSITIVQVNLLQVKQVILSTFNANF